MNHSLQPRSGASHKPHLLLLLVILGLCAGCTDRATPPEPASQLIKVRAGSATQFALVFVHGLGGNRVTWENPATHNSWPQMLLTDRSFDPYDVYIYEYPTSLTGGTLSINELAGTFFAQLQAGGLIRGDGTFSKPVAFVCHSMGGLVVRDLILTNDRLRDGVLFLYFFGTPTNGSQVANIAHLLVRSPQIKEMQEADPDSGSGYLAETMRNWLRKSYSFPSYAAYETQRTHGQMVVTMDSAVALANQSVFAVANCDHISLVKPATQKDESYVFLSNAAVVEASKKMDICKADQVTPERVQKMVRLFETGTQSESTSGTRSNRKVSFYNMSGRRCAITLIDAEAVKDRDSAVQALSHLNNCRSGNNNNELVFDLNEFKSEKGRFLIIIRTIARDGSIKDSPAGLEDLFDESHARYEIHASEDPEQLSLKLASGKASTVFSMENAK